MVKRVFFNVGQALFCKEERGGVCIVYDCGGQNIDIARSAITRSGLDGQHVNALFISHYDRDHINGVYYLLQRCTIEHLFLPMVREEEKLFVLLEHPSRAEVYKLTADVQSVLATLHLQERTKVHIVRAVEVPYRREPADNYNENQIKGRELERSIPIDQIGTAVNSGVPICMDNTDWVYIPFNLQYMSSEDWIDFMRGLGLPDAATCTDVVVKWKKTKLKLKENLIRCGIVSKDDINAHSMTLYSGPLLPNEDKQGCLYTGDYDARINWAKLHDCYNLIWNNIGVVQVPHHGSAKNWNMRLIIPSAAHVISGVRVDTGEQNWVDPNPVVNSISAAASYAVTDTGDVKL